MSLNERIGFTQCTGFPSSSTQQETLSTACCVAKLCCKALQEPRSKCTLQLRTKTVNGLSFNSIGLQEQSRCTGLHNYNVHEMPHCWNPTMNPCSGMRHSDTKLAAINFVLRARDARSLLSFLLVSLVSFFLCRFCLFYCVTCVFLLLAKQQSRAKVFLAGHPRLAKKLTRCGPSFIWVSVWFTPFTASARVYSF